MLGLILATAMQAAAGAPAPRVMTVSTQTSGYPKLHLCASPIAQPEDQPVYSQACRDWRVSELGRISALPLQARIARVTLLRERMGLTPGQGLNVGPDGILVPSRLEMAGR